MSTPLPSLIIGPAIVTWNGYTYYTKAGVTVEFQRATFVIETDFDGKIDERHQAQKTTVSLQPVGSIAGLTACFPYGVGAVGTRLFGTTNLPLVIVTKFGGASNTGQTITYPRAALTQCPPLRLQPTATLFGELAFTCLGDPTVQPNTSTAWEALADVAFADTSFDESAIITDNYSAAWGASPYNAMGSQTGFAIDLTLELGAIDDDSYGHVDLVLKSLTATARFVPNNLTQANFTALLANQNTGYIYPGMSLARATHDLVITGSGNQGSGHTLTATLKNAGPKQGSYRYGVDQHRFASLEFTSRRTWTSGTANPLLTLAAA